MTGAGGWAFLGVFVLFAALLLWALLTKSDGEDEADEDGYKHIGYGTLEFKTDEPDFRELEEAMKNFGSTPIIMELPEQSVTPEFMATMMGDFPNEHGFYELKCLMGCAWLFVSDDYAQAKTMQHEHHVHYHYVGPDEVGDDAYKQFIDGLRWNP